MLEHPHYKAASGVNGRRRCDGEWNSRGTTSRTRGKQRACKRSRVQTREGASGQGRHRDAFVTLKRAFLGRNMRRNSS